MRFVALFFLGGMLEPSAGYAQTPSHPSPTTLQSLFDQGVDAERTGRHAEACALFEEVLRHHDEPLVRVNLAISYRAVGRYVEAIEQLQHYLAAPLPDDSPQRLAQMRDAITEMERTIARVTVTAHPPDARLRVDQRERALGTLRLDPGHHVFELVADRHQPLRHELHLEAGSVHTLTLTLQPVVTTGRVIVTPLPATATVTIDGVHRGTGHIEVTLEQGHHRIEVSAPAYTVLRREFVVTPGGVVHVDATLTPSRTRPAWLWPVVLTGSVLLAGAVATVVVLATRNDDPVLPSRPGTIIPIGP